MLPLHRACSLIHRYAHTCTPSLPCRSFSSLSNNEEEPQAMIDARKREAARSYVARKIFGTVTPSADADSKSSAAPDQSAGNYASGPARDMSLGVASSSRSTAVEGSSEEAPSASTSDEQRNVLARLLQEHQVVVRGGHTEAAQLVDALLEWRAGRWHPKAPSA